ncbi:DUF2169 family type VI secretion system accessory protein [Polyangium mundeleinium]|uniref:DUF2169 domain-containing protein n=1 Tax=Polyangium mundeleinium TaxID=2995306 RepID=A0ABT5F762_9BACT|nr:DUF2169 domain-containing protein [Polyangium mundeleinium]MDC0749944.1 DUF2169 domain-containing protein [Polyangium mundeleinium]
MLATNATPFAALGFEQIHRDGSAMAVIAVRAGFLLTPEKRLLLAPDQHLILADEYEGDPHRTPLVGVCDIVPFKPFADVTILGTAYPPEGRCSTRWYVDVIVGDYDCTLRVHGPRVWTPVDEHHRRTWRPGDVKEAECVAIDYRFAAGGPILGSPDGDVEPRNPIGPGILDRAQTPPETRSPMPMIDSEAAPIDNPFARPEPQGFGPVPPWWSWRQKHAGTYDEAWLKERHPVLPADFDYRFYQTAHPRLILPRYLVGDEIVRLEGVSPDGGSVGFRLPRLSPYARFSWVDGRRVTALLNCDGLHIDARTQPWRVDMTWRGWIAMGKGFSWIDLFVAAQGDASLVNMPRLGLHGLERTEAPA